MRSTIESSSVVIVGASARAAAFSALRAGLVPWCADLFADADLLRVCHVTRLPLDEYPGGFSRLLADAPPGPWLYAGGLENWPGLVQEISASRRLWGNDGQVLRAVRVPWEVAACLAKAGLPGPEVRRGMETGPLTSRWLVKPLASGGGRGMQFWSSHPGPGPSERVYYQEFIEGVSCAAVYLGEGGASRFIGVTRQLVGEPWLHAGPFKYCGSVGPANLTDRMKTAFVRLGDALASRFGLRGLFGVDCVLQGEVPYPVEVNPRYTASVEVLEWATGLAAMAEHCRVFDALPIPGNNPSIPQKVVGKAILFARDSLEMSADGPWKTAIAEPVNAWRDFTDIPHAGERIEKGQPIMTVFARADSEKNCLDELKQRAQALDRWLFAS